MTVEQGAVLQEFEPRAAALRSGAEPARQLT
jgi:hypothetical protein